MIFKEKTISSETIYKGAILNVRKDKVTVEKGTSYREIIEHNGGAVCLPLKEDGKVVLVKQYRKAVDRVMLEVPAGKLEKGEDPMEAAIRELKEETGYTPGKVVLLTAMYPSVGYTEEKLFIYLATDLIEGETNLDENEAIDVVEYPLIDMVEMVGNGEVEDAKTIIAVLLGKLYVEKQ